MTRSGFVNCEFWGTRTSAELFLLCCQVATELGLVIAATSVDNTPGDDECESELDFDIIGNCSVQQFQALTNGIRERRIRVKFAQLGEQEDD